MDASGSEPDRTHLMIVDDHATFADALGTAIDLEDDFVFVGSAGTVSKALALAARTAPDVILLDSRLPDGDGIDAIPHLRLACAHARIIILTGWADLEMMVRAASSGAAGFLPKEAAAAEILAAARTAHEGGLVLDHPTLALVLARARSQSADGPSDKSPERLTLRESEVLVLMGEGLDPRAIAEAVPQRPYRSESRQEHPREARRAQPARSGRVRGPQGDPEAARPTVALP